MNNELVQIRYLTPSLRQACLERGKTFDDEITVFDALKEYSAWHLGDDFWAETIINLYENPKD